MSYEKLRDYAKDYISVKKWQAQFIIITTFSSFNKSLIKIFIDNFRIR